MTEKFVGEPTPEETKKFWYGRDLITAEKVTIDGVTSIPVWPLHGSLPQDIDLSKLSVATRSRFAQWGLEVLQKAPESIMEYEAEMKEQFYAKPPQVLVKNHARKLEIPAGTPIFGFYSRGPRIQGEELADLMGKDIRIDGAWKFVRKDPYTKKAKDITSIAVEIRNGRRWYIPESPDSLDVTDLASARSNYREVLDKEYSQAPRNVPVGIWFGELPDVELSMGVAVEIAKAVAPKLNVSSDVEKMEEERMYPNGRHIGARLLHPGSGMNNPNGWPIRVEIDTKGSVQKPGAIIFRVMRAG